MKKKSISLLLTMLLLSFFAITNAFCLTFYVDTSTGKNNPSWGVKPEKPWKTITFALQQTCMIEICEEVIIEVAAGTYNETVNIIRPISLEGSGAATIIDGGGLDVVTIDGVQKVAIRGFTIQNGNKGIYGKRGSAIEVSDTTVQDCSNNGIQVSDNSTLQISDCTVQRSGGDGIGVYRNSNATFTGTNVSNQNSYGILVYQNSGVNIYGYVKSENNYRGIGVHQNSSIALTGTVDIINCKDRGLVLLASSTYTGWSSNTLTVSGTKDGWGVGINLGDSSVFKSAGSISIQDNSNDGIHMAGNSYLYLYPTTSNNVQILSNGRNGITAHFNSTVFFQEPGVNIANHPGNGIFLNKNSSLDAIVMTINSSGNSAISVVDGSSVNCDNCNLYDTVDLDFASRSILSGGSVESVQCSDATSVSRGDFICTYPSP